MVLFTLLIIPFIIALATFIFGGRKVTLKEFASQLGVQLALIGIFDFAIYYSNTSDTELWNGKVANKERQIVSCSHSYPCNCHEVCSGSGKNESCSTHCDTCYEHSYDVDWPLFTTNNERIEIDRIDRQGVNTPPRWQSVQVGEPTAVDHSFTNYVKASPDTLFRYTGIAEKYQASLPIYPISIHDYYHADRTVLVNVSLPDLFVWNSTLQTLNGELGKKKQVNAIIVIVQGLPEEYFFGLQQHWIGGKKNDAILVIGVNKDLTINWVNVMAWTDHPIFKVKLRDDIINLKTLNREQVFKILQEDIDQLYVRKHMADFKYLQASITPTKGQWIGALIFGLIMSLGLSYLVITQDIFGEE